MVVFTCNHCGDPLRKPKVAVHYQQICRKSPFLTCVDCLKDFRDDEYVAHTKCITEAERYGAKDYVPKPSANKGERKQQEWINVVNDLLNETAKLSNAERNFLNMLSKHENIPRKKAKFLNFIRNAVGNHVNATVVESVWNKMENAHKQTQQVTSKIPEETQEQNKNEVSCTQTIDCNNSFNTQNVAENQNNENIYKENNSVSCQNGNDKMCKTTDKDICERRSKSKKRHLESLPNQLSEEDQSNTNIKKLKSENKKLESLSSDSGSGSEITKFQWKKIIIDTLAAKGEISLRKLRNKVMNKCICYIFRLNNDTFKLCEYAKAIRKFNRTVEKLKESCTISIVDNKVKLL
ncbi:hypothetical protein PUN28_014759 [Cardiocondyla obscurior]|uniref:Zinc finger C2H2 LYAR-type domain-containing protein n=1 Tax=Cardiocondyla obscurior TaxID=286306 RepID=A0AAW2EXS9_9HYME